MHDDLTTRQIESSPVEGGVMKPYPDVPDGLIVTHDDSVLRIRLDRPERRNSLTDPIVYALTDLIEAAASDEDVRVIHLTGSRRPLLLRLRPRRAHGRSGQAPGHAPSTAA